VRVTATNAGRTPAVVVFTNFPATADRVYQFLSRRLGNDRVLRHEPDGSRWTRFIGSDGHVLICDRRAEEGLNLQNRLSVVIHFDLPFSPNRIEQRMGRVDRFGTGRSIWSFAFVASNSQMQIAWSACLDRALGVFDRSIASLQYAIEEEFAAVWPEFLHAGADAITEATMRLGGDQGTVAREFQRIRAQDELEAFGNDERADKEFAEQLERFDLKTSHFRQAVEQWLVQRLHLRLSGEEGRRDDVVRYRLTLAA
jgi:ATP-dependent helicase HepA